MHSAFARTDHRPWPLPTRPWTSAQTWRDLLFAHWPVDPEILRPGIPPRLKLQQFDGAAWIGVVPFRMTGVRPRWVPPIPWLSAFPELNVRTYVECDGVPGVWFLSLDAMNPVAVWGARRFFHLPYHRARIAIHPRDGGFEYASRRRAGPPAELRVRYAPTSRVWEADPGSFAHWLTERYCLYARRPSGDLVRVEIHHHPWPLRDAEAEFSCNTMLSPHGVEVPDRAPVLHFAHRIDVAVWSPERL